MRRVMITDSFKNPEVAYAMKNAKNGWTLLLLILAGVVLGGFIGSLTAGVSGLDWLNYGQSFGLENPIVLSLGLLVFTFGLTIKVTIASTIGMILAILVYRWI